MVKKIENFEKLYRSELFAKNGDVFVITPNNIIRTSSEPELIEYFDVKRVVAPVSNVKYSVGIFADNINKMNKVCVYKKGESMPALIEDYVSKVHFRKKDYFKTYVVTLINKLL